jgi:hypothetical protein
MIRTETMQAMAGCAAAVIPDQSERREFLDWLQSSQERKRRKDKLLTSREAAQHAGVHVRTLQKWGKKGWLHPNVITPRRIRWSRRELLGFLGESEWEE